MRIWYLDGDLGLSLDWLAAGAGAGWNPAVSLDLGRCNDYPEREYMQVHGSAVTYTYKYDIVCSVW